MDKVTKLEELNIGDFVKVSQTNGPVKDRMDVSGEIVKLYMESNLFEIKTFDGTMGLPFTTDKDFVIEVTKLKQKPNGWKEFIKNPEKFNTPEVVEIKKTKKERVFDIVKENKNKKEKSILSLCEKHVGGDPDLLITYIRAALQRLR